MLQITRMAAMVAGLGMIVGTASAEDAVNLMNKQPTEQELIDALKLPGKTRGIQPVAANEPKPVGKVDLAINFDFNSADLTPEAMQTLATVAGALRSDALADQNFMIEGHTDAVGDDHYNFSLSERRAQAVWSYLVEQQSVQSQQLFPLGKGEQELLVPDDPKAAQNRRVRISAMIGE